MSRLRTGAKQLRDVLGVDTQQNKYRTGTSSTWIKEKKNRFKSLGDKCERKKLRGSNTIYNNVIERVFLKVRSHRTRRFPKDSQSNKKASKWKEWSPILFYPPCDPLRYMFLHFLSKTMARFLADVINWTLLRAYCLLHHPHTIFPTCHFIGLPYYIYQRGLIPIVFPVINHGESASLEWWECQCHAESRWGR
jgi:hypothetical protein